MTRLLLDTNQVLFICQAPELLSEAAERLLWEKTAEVYVSAAAFWEIDLKARSLKTDGTSRLPLKRPPVDMLGYFLRKGVKTLAIEPRHTFAVLEHPLAHKDPFDWLLVRQAQVEEMMLMTSDMQLSDHPRVAYVGRATAR